MFFLYIETISEGNFIIVDIYNRLSSISETETNGFPAKHYDICIMKRNGELTEKCMKLLSEKILDSCKENPGNTVKVNMPKIVKSKKCK